MKPTPKSKRLVKRPKKLKINFEWPKESPEAKKAIETLVNEGYIFHTSVVVSVDGMKKSFGLEKK